MVEEEAEHRLPAPGTKPGYPVAEQARPHDRLGAPAGALVEPGQRDTEGQGVERHPRDGGVRRRLDAFRGDPARDGDRGDRPEHDREAEPPTHSAATTGPGGTGGTSKAIPPALTVSRPAGRRPPSPPFRAGDAHPLATMAARMTVGSDLG